MKRQGPRRNLIAVGRQTCRQHVPLTIEDSNDDSIVEQDLSWPAAATAIASASALAGPHGGRGQGKNPFAEGAKGHLIERWWDESHLG
jgi:hypothetical protein